MPSPADESGSVPPSGDNDHFQSKRTQNSTTTNVKNTINRLNKPHQNWTGAKLLACIISIAIGLIVRFAIPKPHALSKQAWQLLAIFLTTISGLILSPLPVGSWALFCLTIAIITRTLTFAAAFDAFKSEVIWLIVASFFFSRGFIKTGLGNRVAMWFVRWLGKTTLGLSYGLVLSEAAIAPAMPSVTARAGGIFLPIIKSLALGVNSSPKDGSARKIGAFLIQAQLQCSTSASALYLTASASNLLSLKLAESLGVKLHKSWLTWLKVTCIPGFVSLALLPFIVYKLFPPEIKETPDAPTLAKAKLKEMGPVKMSEWVMVITMLITVGLWVSGEHLEIPAVVAALVGFSILLLFGVIDWQDCLGEKSAWDTLVWFGVLVGMATQLNNLGVVPWLSLSISNSLKSLSLSWFGAFVILHLAYFALHYLFASQTAHVGALYSAFLGMLLVAKVPPLMAAISLAVNTNLFGALTHYSSGQAAVYYGAGYVKLPRVFRMGIMVALINIIIWSLTAAAWWKILGLY